MVSVSAKKVNKKFHACVPLIHSDFLMPNITAYRILYPNFEQRNL
jgi:hypothetical protein